MAARGPPRVDAPSARRQRHGRRLDLRQSPPVQRGVGLQPLPAQRGPGPGDVRGRGGRPGLRARGRGDLSARVLDHGVDRRGRAAVGGRRAARPLRWRGDRGGDPVRPGQCGAGVFRPEGRAAGHGHPPDGARSRDRDGGRHLSHDPGGRRARAVLTERAPQPGGPCRGAGPAAGAGRGARCLAGGRTGCRAASGRDVRDLDAGTARGRRVRLGRRRHDAGGARGRRRSGTYTAQSTPGTSAD